MMSLSIRLNGFSHEVDRMLEILERSPEITVERQSREYPDRGSSYVRRYIDIELKDIGGEQDA